MSSIPAACDFPMEEHHHLAARVPISRLPQPLAPILVSPRWGFGLVWLTGPQEKMGEEGAFGISLWKQTHPALPTPPALQGQEVAIEKDLEVEEEELVVVVVVEEEGCRLSQPTAICQPSWAT